MLRYGYLAPWLEMTARLGCFVLAIVSVCSAQHVITGGVDVYAFRRTDVVVAVSGYFGRVACLPALYEYVPYSGRN